MTQPRKLGKPLPLSAADLDAAAEVTPVDVAQAKVLWDQHAPKKLRDLLEASQPPKGGTQ